jgi:hypothetical protein
MVVWLVLGGGWGGQGGWVRSYSGVGRVDDSVNILGRETGVLLRYGVGGCVGSLHQQETTKLDGRHNR